MSQWAGSHNRPVSDLSQVSLITLTTAWQCGSDSQYWIQELWNRGVIERIINRIITIKFEPNALKLVWKSFAVFLQQCVKICAGKNADWADFKQTAMSDKFTWKTKQRWAVPKVSGNTHHLHHILQTSLLVQEFMHQLFSCSIRDLCWHLKGTGFQPYSGLGRLVAEFMSHCLCLTLMFTVPVIMLSAVPQYKQTVNPATKRSLT